MEENSKYKKIANFLKGVVYGNAKTGFGGLLEIIKKLEEGNIDKLGKLDVEFVYWFLGIISYSHLREISKVHPFLYEQQYNIRGIGNYTLSTTIEQAINVIKEVLSQIENPKAAKNYTFILPKGYHNKSFIEYAINNKEKIEECLHNLEEVIPYLKSLETLLRQKS